MDMMRSEGTTLASRAAIVIKMIAGTRRHLGVVYSDDNTAFSVLHLAWHHVLLNDPWDNDWMVCGIALHSTRLQQLASMCRIVWESNGNEVPYAFSPPAGGIDSDTGLVVLGPTRYGFTCSSFVIALFDAISAPIVAISSWPVDRPGDREFQEFVVSMLKRGATHEHVKNVQSEIGTVRFRPEEVAAAAEHNPHPAHFSMIESRSLEIVADLNKSAVTP